MKIERLHLERYGMFSDRTLAFNPDAALHIVLGANEAGKTSALSAIGDFIFGFGGRTVYDFKHDGKTLRVGGSLRHSDGRVVTARRRKGNKNTLVDDNDEPLADDLISAFVGGVSRDVFESEFGLTAEALRRGSEELLTAGGRLAETLAASSAGMSALSELTSRLKMEADEIFTSRKSGTRLFYVATDRRDQAEQILRDAIVTRDAMKRANEDYAAAAERLEALNESHSALGKSLALCQRAQRVRPILLRLESLAADLAESSGLADATEHQITEWRGALARLDDLRRQMAVLDDADARDLSELEILSVDEELLAQGAAIDALRERLGAVRKAADDLPRRRQARDAAAAFLDDAARKLSLPSHAEVLAKLPNDMALADARDLIDKRKKAEMAVAEADGRCVKLRKEHDEHSAQDTDIHPQDVDRLRQRFDALGDVVAQMDRLRRDRSALETEVDSIAAALSSLRPAAGRPENVRSLPIPDAADIASYVRLHERASSGLDEAQATLALTAKALSSDEADLARLSRDGVTATQDDLRNARDARDATFAALKDSLGGEPLLREQRLGELDRSLQTIDSVTDRLLDDTQRATRLADIRQRLDEDRRALKAQAASHDAARVELNTVEVAWRQLWKPSGVVPDEPKAMARWREKLDALLGRLSGCDAKKAEVAALEARLMDRKQAIVAFLNSVGRTVDASLAPDVLFGEAEARLDQIQEAWTQTRTRSFAKVRIERDLEEAEAAKASAKALLKQYAAQWPAAMARIGLDADLSAVSADAAIAVWQSIPLAKNNYEREGRSVSSIESDLRVFDEDVFGIIDRAASQLRAPAAKESLGRLVAALDETRRCAEGRQRLEKAALERAPRRRVLTADVNTVEKTLTEACRNVAAADIGHLSGTLDRIAGRQVLLAEQAKGRRDLPGIADGLGEAVLRQESEALDFDELPSRIAREEAQQRDLLKEIAQASADKQQKLADIEAFAAGRNAEVAVAERAAANADILSHAEAWIRRAAAARLGALAIERHRSKVQDPLVLSAGSFFSEATNGAFAGLVIDYGEDDQPTLVAQRDSGERVAITGLSEGTRDQLFLSLRLALLAQRTSEPMPFIGDDLLASFDDERTGATLRLLAAAAPTASDHSVHPPSACRRYRAFDCRPDGRFN